MTVEIVNPAPVIDQLEGQWEKVFAIALWKLKKSVTLTVKDFQDYERDYLAGKAMFYVHGHRDSFDFRIVTKEESERLVRHFNDTNQSKGTA